MYNEIKRELYATDCKCSEIKFYTVDRLPRCFGCQMFKTWAQSLEECTRQLTRMMDVMPSDFTVVNSTLPACAVIPNQQNFTRHDERFNFSSIFSGMFALLSIAIKHTDIRLEFVFVKNRKSFEYFFCFY